MSLRNRLSILVGLALLPPIALLGYDTIETRVRERTHLLDQARTQARLMAGQVDAVVQGARRLAWAVARQAGSLRDDPARCADALHAIVSEDPVFRLALVTDREGKVICSWPAAERAVILRDRPYFREALEKDEAVIGALVLRERIAATMVLPIARRYRAENEIGGVISLGLDVDQLARHFRDSETWSNHAVSVIDRAGTVVLRVPDEPGTVGRMAPEALLRLTDQASFGSFAFAAKPGETALVGYAKAAGLTVLVSHDPERLLAQADQITIRNALLMGLVLILAIASAWTAGERLLRRPISALIDAARRQEKGERDVPFPELKPSTELGELALRLNRLSDSNRDLLAQREVLMRELQHRVMNSLQLLASFLHLQSRNADPVTRDQLDAARERIVSMSRIFRYLYRSDLGSTVAFGEFLESFCRDTSRAYLGIHAPKLEVKADAAQFPLETALSLALMTHELITNAIKHAFAPGKPGKIKVTFRVLSGGSSELKVADDGTGMPRDFDSAKSKSFGIVLIQRLAQSLQGEVRVHSGAGGTEFKIALPAPSRRAKN